MNTRASVADPARPRRVARGCVFAAALGFGSSAFAQSYYTYPQVEAAVAAAEANYPALCRRQLVGTTVQGRNIWALCISDNVQIEEDEPEVALISTMHGNEPVGTEMMLRLITHLTSNYGVNQRVTDLVNNVELWIVPVMNPDGFVAGTRQNANGVDLNRNFPDPYTSPNNTIAGRQAETAAIMTWRWTRSFVLSANFHTGALVVNYPYDANPNGQSVYTPCPDDDLFIYVSERYSQYNPPMWSSPTFFHGITNGAAWYHVNGGMQDWAYRYTGSNEVTIELSNTFAPPAAQLEQYWNENRDSLMSYVETSLIGARGVVTAFPGGAPLAATVSVVGRAVNGYTDPDVGDYHRMLMPGNYTLRFESLGRETRQVPVVVSAGPATRFDLMLSGPPTVLSPNGGETLSIGVPTTITWSGNPEARFHVQYTLDADSQSISSDGFESPTFDPVYSTGGAAGWFMVNIPVHSGTRSARAGIISHGQQSWLKRTVSGPATVSFWYRVSSEANKDYFRFYVDGVEQLAASGTVAFTLFTSGLIPAGAHELKWEYSKDGANSVGADTCWIDDLAIALDGATWFDVTPLTGVGDTSTAWTPPAASTQAKVRVRAFYDGTLYGNWDLSNANFSVVPGVIAGDLNCDGVLNVDDAPPFVLALVDPAAYAAQYPLCQLNRGDMDDNSTVDGDDIQPFVSALVGP